MVVGTTLLKLNGAPYYSPSFPRGGLGAVFAADVTHYSGLASFTITIEHRDDNETSWASLGVFTAITGSGTATKDVADIKQILRFKFELAGSNVYDGVHFVMQAPSWRPYD